MLEPSRAKQLASDGVERQALERAQRRLSGAESRLAALQAERQRTRWYQRSQRANLERLIEQCHDDRQRRMLEVERLARPLELPAAVERPMLRRGRDPLAPLVLERQRAAHRDTGREL